MDKSLIGHLLNLSKNRLSFTYSFQTCKDTSWLFGPLTPCFYSPEEPSPRLLPPSVLETSNSSLPPVHPMYLQHVSFTTSCPFSHPCFSGRWVQLAMLVGMLTHLPASVCLRVRWPCHVLKTACHPSFCPSTMFSEPWGLWDLDMYWRLSTSLQKHLFSVLQSTMNLYFSYDCCREKPGLRAAPSMGLGKGIYKTVWLYGCWAEQQ